MRKCARGEGFVDECGQCWHNCVKTLKQKRRRNRIQIAGFRGRFVPDFVDSGFRDRPERQKWIASEGFAKRMWRTG